MLKRRPSLRTVLLSISLLFLLLPLGGLYFLRIYQSALVRQTQSELISQAAFVAALYKHQVQTLLAQQPHAGYGLPLPVAHPAINSRFQLIPARLDLARDKLYPVRPEPLFTTDPPDPIGEAAGADILPILQDAQRITLSGIKVLDYQGLVTAGTEEVGLSFAQTEEFQQAKTGHPISLLRKRRMPNAWAALGSASRNADFNVFVALPVVLNDRLIGVVWVNRTPTDLIQALYGKQMELFWTALAVLSAAFLVTGLTAYTVTQPMHALMRKNRLIAAGDPEGLLPLARPMTREIAELSGSITTMARTIQHRSEYIRNFAAHVSHEFKTPLTAIQGSVELLKDNLSEMPQAQQARFLSNIAEDTHRLQRLVSRLLELARADMAEPVREKTMLMPILTEWAHRYTTNTFEVIVHAAGLAEDLAVYAVAENLDLILSNLLENSRQAQASRVEINVQAEASAVILLFSDNGPGISPRNRADVFTPFFTTRRATGGTGLGLSIIQSLLERQGGQITLLPHGEGGACFQITLPTA